MGKKDTEYGPRDGPDRQTMLALHGIPMLVHAHQPVQIEAENAQEKKLGFPHYKQTFGRHKRI
jgi:hypothetical protein